MPIPGSREGLLEAIETNFRHLDKELRTVPASRGHEATLEGHARNTVMSVHNLASYLLGWNRLVLKWMEKDAKGESIDFPETGFRWNQLGKLAQKFYSDSDAVPLDRLLDDLEAAKLEIVTLISTQTNERLYGKSWYRKYTMGRMIQLNTSSPYANARTRLRRWKRQHDIM